LRNRRGMWPLGVYMGRQVRRVPPSLIATAIVREIDKGAP
jgi:hypothetical protein